MRPPVRTDPPSSANTVRPAALSGPSWASAGGRIDLGIEARRDQFGFQEGGIAVTRGELRLRDQGATGQQPATQRRAGQPQKRHRAR